MSIRYDKLFALISQRGKNEYYLRKNGISPSILVKLKQDTGGLDARTIDRLCTLLDCQPGDLMEYISDNAPSGSIEETPEPPQFPTIEKEYQEEEILPPTVQRLMAAGIPKEESFEWCKLPPVEFVKRVGTLSPDRRDIVIGTTAKDLEQFRKREDKENSR